jgi:hypothetical protein
LSSVIEPWIVTTPSALPDDAAVSDGEVDAQPVSVSAATASAISDA